MNGYVSFLQAFWIDKDRTRHFFWFYFCRRRSREIHETFRRMTFPTFENWRVKGTETILFPFFPSMQIFRKPPTYRPRVTTVVFTEDFFCTAYLTFVDESRWSITPPFGASFLFTSVLPQGAALWLTRQVAAALRVSLLWQCVAWPTRLIGLLSFGLRPDESSWARFWWAAGRRLLPLLASVMSQWDSLRPFTYSAHRRWVDVMVLFYCPW